jgi:hypothetical protein
MAAPERFAETSDSSCTAGAVHTWHLRMAARLSRRVCEGPLLGTKQTCRSPQRMSVVEDERTSEWGNAGREFSFTCSHRSLEWSLESVSRPTSESLYLSYLSAGCWADSLRGSLSSWCRFGVMRVTTGVPDADYEAAAAEFSDKELADLTYAIGLMNAFNRLGISFRTPPAAAKA